MCRRCPTRRAIRVRLWSPTLPCLRGGDPPPHVVVLSRRVVGDGGSHVVKRDARISGALFVTILVAGRAPPPALALLERSRSFHFRIVTLAKGRVGDALQDRSRDLLLPCLEKKGTRGVLRVRCSHPSLTHSGRQAGAAARRRGHACASRPARPGSPHCPVRRTTAQPRLNCTLRPTSLHRFATTILKS